MNVNCADPDEKSRSVFIDKTRNGPSVAASASVPEKGQSLPSGVWVYCISRCMDKQSPASVKQSHVCRV
jgi:hypothetical protein